MANCQENSQQHYIERCPHDRENPYVMVSRDLIRDASLSPECRWLLTYLLSMDRGWKVSHKQIYSHAKQFIGQKKIYSLLKEAIKAGYMTFEYLYEGNLRKGGKYYLSERPKFKNSNNFSDVAISDTPKIAARKKELLIKEITSSSSPLAQKEEELNIDLSKEAARDPNLGTDTHKTRKGSPQAVQRPQKRNRSKLKAEEAQYTPAETIELDKRFSQSPLARENISSYRRKAWNATTILDVRESLAKQNVRAETLQSKCEQISADFHAHPEKYKPYLLALNAHPQGLEVVYANEEKKIVPRADIEREIELLIRN